MINYPFVCFRTERVKWEDVTERLSTVSDENSGSPGAKNGRG